MEENKNQLNLSAAQPDPQKKIEGKPAFKKDEPKPVTSQKTNTAPQKEKPIPPKKPQKKGSGLALWFFFGVVLFLFIGLLVASVYMLQTEGGSRIFETLNIDINQAFDGLRNIVNGFYIFFTLILVLMLMIGAGMLASAKPGSTTRRSGIRSLVFSIMFILILGASYVAVFPVLYGNYQANETNFAKYVVITPDPPEGSAPLRVFFNAAAIDKVNDNLFYEWDFGDDSKTGTGPTPSHEYTKPGLYRVKLTLSNAESTQEVDLGVNVLIHNSSAVPVISTDIKQGKSPLTVNFDATKSEDPNGQIINYLWDFDDEQSQNNQAKGTEAVHTFDIPGNYEVELSIEDSNKEIRKTTQTIVVTSNESGIIPKIVASPLQGSAPLKVNFNSSGSEHTEANRSLISYEWDFGDGTPVVRSREITHSFAENGVYNVILTVTDDMDNTKQETIEINVTDELLAPESKIISKPAILVGDVPFNVSFSGISSLDKDGEIVNYEWDFGDGSAKENGPTIDYTFEEVGQFTVVLKVEDNDGKFGTNSAIVTVNEVGAQPPIAKLTTDPTPPQGIAPFLITFDASDSTDIDGNIISYTWDFGDQSRETQTTSPEVKHKYEQVGIWPVTLTVTDSDGMTGEATIKVAVNNRPPEAKIDSSKTTAYAPAKIQFDASESSGDITSYIWNFGDGIKSQGMISDHQYTKKGVYSVELTIEDAQGQIDITETTITIK